MREIEQADSTAKEELIAQAMACLAAKLNLSGSTTPLAQPALANTIEISSADGPDRIRQKADLLSDMADKAAAQLSGVEARLTDLRLERRMRVKMSQFAEEIAFFDDMRGYGWCFRKGCFLNIGVGLAAAE